MSIRYLGFEPSQNKRLYQFECQAHGRSALRLVVSADLTLFSAHRVNIQDGPALCARRLAADPALARQQHIELTDDDFRAHAACQAAVEQRKATARRRLNNRVPERRPRSLRTGHWG
ncbi:MAG TPA: hypothetical protein VGH38_11010 [Bryobacteraceae bacterium]